MWKTKLATRQFLTTRKTCHIILYHIIIIIIIISGFGIYGAAVVPDSGVGNTWQRLTLVLHEFLSNGLTPSRLHIISHTYGPRLPWPPTISGAGAHNPYK